MREIHSLFILQRSCITSSRSEKFVSKSVPFVTAPWIALSLSFKKFIGCGDEKLSDFPKKKSFKKFVTESTLFVIYQTFIHVGTMRKESLCFPYKSSPENTLPSAKML